MDGTILVIKRGGSEIALILTNNPAVLSLRDFIYESPAEGLRLHQIVEGTRVVVHDIGSWNPKSDVFHGARISWKEMASIPGAHITDSIGYPETSPGGFGAIYRASLHSAPSPPAMQAILVNNSDIEPPRRKPRLTMVL